MPEDIDPEVLKERDPGKAIPPLAGALVKNGQDVQLFKRRLRMRTCAGTPQAFPVFIIFTPQSCAG